MSTRSVKHDRYLIIFGPKVAIHTSAVAFAVSNLIRPEQEQELGWILQIGSLGLAGHGRWDLNRGEPTCIVYTVQYILYT